MLNLLCLLFLQYLEIARRLKGEMKQGMFVPVTTFTCDFKNTKPGLRKREAEAVRSQMKKKKVGKSRKRAEPIENMIGLAGESMYNPDGSYRRVVGHNAKTFSYVQ
jgi:hypothetical protein